MVLLVPEEKPQPSWGQRWDSFCCWANREPQLTVRRVVWIVTVGARAASYTSVADWKPHRLHSKWRLQHALCSEEVPVPVARLMHQVTNIQPSRQS